MIYSHFADRQAILVAIVRDAFGELREELLAAGDGGADRHLDDRGVNAGLDLRDTHLEPFPRDAPPASPPSSRLGPGMDVLAGALEAV